MTPVLDIQNLSVSLGGQPVLTDISFTLERGDALAVIGPNGSGKTTLFRAILGAIPYSGSIVRAPGVRIGYVPQKIDLERDLPLSVSEFLNLHYGAGAHHPHNNSELLEMVGLPAIFLSKRISELSSGEFQRIFIAWAVADRPDLLLFDEPTASVDVAGQENVYELLHRLQEAHGITLLLISHDLTVVYRYANKVLCLNRTAVCFGTPREVLTPDELNRVYGGGAAFYGHLHA